MVFRKFIDRLINRRLIQHALWVRWGSERQLEGLLPAGNERYLGFLITQHRVPGPDRMCARRNIGQSKTPVLVGYRHIRIRGQQKPTFHKAVLIT